MPQTYIENKFRKQLGKLMEGKYNLGINQDHGEAAPSPGRSLVLGRGHQEGLPGTTPYPLPSVFWPELGSQCNWIFTLT